MASRSKRVRLTSFSGLSSDEEDYLDFQLENNDNLEDLK